MNWNIAPEFVSLIFISILITYSKEYNLLPTLKNKLFRFCLFFIFFEILLSIASIIAIENYRNVPIILNQIIQISFFLISPMMVILFMFYIIAVIRETDPKIVRYFHLGMIPYVIYTILVFMNPFNGFLYSLDKVNGFVFGKGFTLTTFFPMAYVFAVILIIFLNRKIMENHLKIILVSFPLISLVLLGLQWIFPSIIFSGTAATSALLIIYLYLHNKQVILDDLTGLQNRKTFSKMLLLNIQKKRNMEILLVSLDDFKLVNDKFGYMNGDEFLKTITRYLIQLSPIKSIYRFSGDEFIMILDKDSLMPTEKIAEAIMKRFEDYWIFGAYKTKIDTSIAVIRVPEHADTMESIVALLEYCIDLSKKGGKGKIIFSDSAKVDKLKRKSIIIERIKWGLSHDMFNVFYQPIYCIKDKKFTTAEALLRFSDHELGPISLGELISIAEETGLIIDIGLLVLDKVCKFIKALEVQVIDIDAISINLSIVQLISQGFKDKFLEIIYTNQIQPSKLRLEITESVFIENAEFINNMMLQLNEHGINFYMDDFGTGYSNMVSIINLPFEFIKIDKSILYESINNKKCFSVLTGFCRTFKEVEMKIVIEGVETREQFEIAEKINADYIQGFLFAQPIPDFEAMWYFGKNNKEVNAKL